jgi:hypothetical protein
MATPVMSNRHGAQLTRLTNLAKPQVPEVSDPGQGMEGGDLALSEPERQRLFAQRDRQPTKTAKKSKYLAENRPKHFEYPRPKPNQIDKEVAREVERDQTGRDDDTGHRNASPSHIEPPSGLWDPYSARVERPASDTAT